MPPIQPHLVAYQRSGGKLVPFFLFIDGNNNRSWQLVGDSSWSSIQVTLRLQSPFRFKFWHRIQVFAIISVQYLNQENHQLKQEHDRVVRCQQLILALHWLGNRSTMQNKNEPRCSIYGCSMKLSMPLLQKCFHDSFIGRWRRWSWFPGRFECR